MTFPEAGYWIAASRLRPRLDGGYTVAALQRALDMHRFGGVAPTLLTFDFGAPYSEALVEFRALGLADASTRIRNLWDDAQADRSWLLAAAGPAVPRADGQRYTEYADAAGDVVLALPYVQRVDWHLATEPIEVWADGAAVGSYAGFGALYRAWVNHVLGAAGHARDVVIVEARQVGELLAEASVPRRYEIVHTVHNAHTQPPYAWDSEMDLLWTQWFAGIDRYDGVVWLTDGQRKDALRRFGAQLADAGVDTDATWAVVPHPARAVATLPDPAARDPHRLVMITRLAPMKRVDDAIRALAHVADTGARLDILGDGPLRAELEALAAQLGVADRVTFLGHVDEPQRELDTAAALLVTSRYEGQSLAVTDALSHGTPAIAYDIHYGPGELIVDGETGYLVEGGDVEALADRIRSVVGRPDEIARLSRAAWTWADAHGPAEAMASWTRLFTTLTPRSADRETTAEAR